MADGTGTAADPWVLTTAPGSSSYTMHRDPDADPPALVCQVGSTTLRYHLAAVEDLHRWLGEQGGWVDLGAADEKKGFGRFHQMPSRTDRREETLPVAPMARRRSRKRDNPG